MPGRRKKCAYCGELVDDAEKTPHAEWYCPSCFSDHFEWCNVCHEYQYTDGQTCRHIFWTWTGNGWMGIGGYDHDWPYHKASFFAVLRKTQAAHELRTGIVNGSLQTRYGGPMIGRGWYDCKIDLGREWADNIGHCFTDDLDRDEEEGMATGVGWLDSIACDVARKKFPEAIKLTLQWIDEWEAAEKRHRELLWFHGQHPFQRAARQSLEVRAKASKIAPITRQSWLSNCGRYVGWREPDQHGSMHPAFTDGENVWRWANRGPFAFGIGSWGNRGDRNFDVSAHGPGLTNPRTILFDRPVENYSVPAHAIQ